MKTLTELNGILIRKAAAAIAEAKRALPEEAPPPEPAAGAAPPAEATPPVQDAPPAEGAEAVAPPVSKGPPAEAPESEAVKAALDAAAAAATGLSGDRLARLRDAVVVVGGRLDDVRLVRVFGPEEPVPGATTRGGFQYLVDLSPASMRQEWSPRKEKRSGGGKGRGVGKGAPASGGFSMDSLREDRKGSRGPGGGRGRPGGGSGR